MITRYSARAVVFNPKNEVLLMRFVLNMIKGDKVLWVYPGGGLKENETFEEALKRELLEETGIVLPHDYKWIWTRDKILQGNKSPIRSYERYYLLYISDENFHLQANFTHNEQNSFLSYKWWTCEEIYNSKEEFALENSYTLINDLINNNIPSAPIDVDLE